MAYKEYPKTCIYIIQSGEYLKIGISVSPKLRMNELQVGNPVTLKILRSYRLDMANAIKVEIDMLRILKDNHVRGEWYKLEPETAFEAVEREITKLEKLEITHNGVRA